MGRSVVQLNTRTDTTQCPCPPCRSESCQAEHFAGQTPVSWSSEEVRLETELEKCCLSQELGLGIPKVPAKLVLWGGRSADILLASRTGKPWKKYNQDLSFLEAGGCRWKAFQ